MKSFNKKNILIFINLILSFLGFFNVAFLKLGFCQSSNQNQSANKTSTQLQNQTSNQNINQINLAKLNPDKIMVLGGNVLCQPKSSSFAWIVPGEGKILYAFTEEGSILWQKSFKSKLNPYISVGLCDVIYLVTKDSVLNMLNPGGTLIWSVNCNFNILEDPLPGKDGRVFVRGKNNLECYGINGVLRWKLKTENQNTKLPLVELNDGSLLVFQEKLIEGKSVARRLSPFGQISEEIIFSSEVLAVKSTSEGVLLSFADGSLGMCSTKKTGETYSKWVLSSESFKSDSTKTSSKSKSIIKFAQNVPYKNIEFVISSNPAKINLINISSGTLIKSFSTSLPDTVSLRYVGFSNDGLVLCDKKNAFCYSFDLKTSSDVSNKSSSKTSSQNQQINQNPQIKLVWSANFNQQKNWSYIYPTSKGYLTFCTNNWVIEAYRVKQNIGQKTSSSSQNQKYKVPERYQNFYTNQSSFTSNLSKSIPQNLSQKMHKAFIYGDFGQDEQEWLNLLYQELNKLYADFQTTNSDFTVEKPYFRKNISYAQEILQLNYESGICTETQKLSNLLRKTQDSSILLCLINCAKTQGLDPNGEVLSALDYVLRNKISTKDSSLIVAIADATLEICKFMGRPSFFDKGQAILTFMLYPQFDEKVHAKARETLNKIIELKL